MDVVEILIDQHPNTNAVDKVIHTTPVRVGRQVHFHSCFSRVKMLVCEMQ